MLYNADGSHTLTSAEYFAQSGWAGVKGYIPPEAAMLLSEYAYNELQTNPQPEQSDQEVRAHAVYGDPRMEQLLATMITPMQSYTGLMLYPTYSYYRVYQPGETLYAHKDRPSCEISATLCLGYDYKDMDPDYHWSMTVGETNGNTYRPKMGPGDAVVYRGCDIRHWRATFDANPGSWQAQVFLHYVDANGPHHEFRYDKRPRLGVPKNAQAYTPENTAGDNQRDVGVQQRGEVLGREQREVLQGVS